MRGQCCDLGYKKKLRSEYYATTSDSKIKD